MQPLNAAEGSTTPGLRLVRWTAKTSTYCFKASHGLCLGCQRYFLGNRPHTRTAFPGNGDHHLGGIFSAGDQWPVAFAQADLGFPTHVLDGLGHLLKAELERPANFGWVALGPGPFDQSPTGMGIPSLGNATLTPPLARRVFRGG